MITKGLRALRGERDVLTQTGCRPVQRSSHMGSHMLAVMLGGRDYGPIYSWDSRLTKPVTCTEDLQAFAFCVPDLCCSRPRCNQASRPSFLTLVLICVR